MRLHHSLAALALALAAACAPATTGGSSPEEGSASPDRIFVQVSNTVTPPTPLTVYAAPQGGGNRRLLGTVSPNRTETFRFNMTLSSGAYLLMGRTTGGREIVTTPIVLTGGETVIWDVQLNSIRVSPRG
jgi:hypothetical protein